MKLFSVLWLVICLAVIFKVTHDVWAREPRLCHIQICGANDISCEWKLVDENTKVIDVFMKFDKKKQITRVLCRMP